ncbi:MAG: hypothetical protein WCK00_15030, partial [Deltaproteobacteria bacterium]
MLPTPRARLTGAVTPNRANDKFNNLESVLARQMWPTPRSGKTTDENEETWMVRKKAGKVATPPLTLAVKMWPTPKGSPSGPDFARMNRDGSGGDDLVTAVAREKFPTPTSSMVTEADFIQAKFHSSKRPTYQDAKNFPTPMATDWKGRSTRSPGKERPESDDDLPTRIGGSLNPTWVEWLMGWPLGWTDLQP